MAIPPLVLAPKNMYLIGNMLLNSDIWECTLHLHLLTNAHHFQIVFNICNKWMRNTIVASTYLQFGWQRVLAVAVCGWDHCRKGSAWPYTALNICHAVCRWSFLMQHHDLLLRQRAENTISNFNSRLVSNSSCYVHLGE